LRLHGGKSFALSLVMLLLPCSTANNSKFKLCKKCSFIL
jgi:hypothetical protein